MDDWIEWGRECGIDTSAVKDYILSFRFQSTIISMVKSQLDRPGFVRGRDRVYLPDLPPGIDIPATREGIEPEGGIEPTKGGSDPMAAGSSSGTKPVHDHEPVKTNIPARLHEAP